MADDLQTIVQKMVAAGEPEDNIKLVIQQYKAPPPPTDAPAATEPGLLSRIADAVSQAGPVSAIKEAVGLAKAHPVQAGAMVGGALATGGASIPASIGLAGLGAAGGAGIGQIAKGAMTGDYGTPSGNAIEMAKQAGLAAGGEGAGQLAGKALQLGARGAYRVALAPTQQTLGKYGDVVGEGLDTATPVSKAGLAKATATKIARIVQKADALKAADQNVGYSANQIANEASGPLSEYATRQVRAGLADPTGDFADRLAQFKAANPNGTLTPSSLDQIQSTLNDQAGGAFKKIRMREPLSTDDKGTVEMLNAIKQTQASGVPGIGGMNRSIMDAEGLRRAIERRTLGSGGNQVLDTLLMLMRGPAGIPGRVAMMPPVLSQAGIAAHQTAPAAPTALRALIQALAPQTPQDQP